MVAHVLADAGQVDGNRYAQPIQLLPRTKTGQHQELRRGHRPGAQYDVAALDHEGLATAVHLHSDRPFAVRTILQHNAVSLYVGTNGQVKAVPHRVDVGQGHAHPHAVDVVLCAQADAGGLGVVHVGVERIPCTGGSPEERLLQRGPRLPMVVADGHRAVGAVKIVVEIGIVLQLAKVGQTVDIGPAFITPRRPGIVVLGCAPDESLAVYGAGAAQDLAPGHGHGFGLLGRGGTGE